MRVMKKVLAVVLALTVTMAFSFTAMADTNSADGSITVKNATIGATYTISKLFDLTYAKKDDGTADKEKVVYTTTNADLVAAINGDSDSPLEATKAAGSSTYNVTLKDGKTKSDVSIDYIKSLQEYAVKQSEKPADASVITFSSLPYGYYFIESTVEDGAVVTIDSTLKDVTVIDKNEGPTWGDPEDPTNPENPNNPDDGTVNTGKAIIGEKHKSDSYTSVTPVYENDAFFGDGTKFRISIDATAFKGEDLVTYYFVKDELDTGFTFKQIDKVEVVPYKFSGDKNVFDSAVEPSYTNIASSGANGFELKIPFGTQYGSNARIIIEYSAELNDTAVIDGDGNENKAYFAYAVDSNYVPDPTDPGYYDPGNPNNFPDPGSPSYPDPKKTNTLTYALGIQKVDQDGNALKGSKFTISGGVDTTVPVKLVTTGVYEYDPSGDDAMVLVPDGSGYLVVKGLDSGNYSLTEVEAPNGYNLLTKTVDFELKKGACTSTVLSTTCLAQNVVNKKGPELPQTGGIGTKIFYVLGTILALGAAIVLITRRRMNAK